MIYWTNSVLLSSLNKNVINTEIYRNLSWNWNIGATLGLNLVFQILTGVFLAFGFFASHFTFWSFLENIIEIRYGNLIRYSHANGARFFFIFLYWHLGRNIFYFSFSKKITWISGVSIFLLSMITAFLGYVLPWGQMSLWGARVITSLITCVPVYGSNLLNFIWGGFRVSKITLIRFFCLHFIIPLFIFSLVVAHVVFLHEKGSSSPVLLQRIKIKFRHIFLIKDFVFFFLIMVGLFTLVLSFPLILGDPENFNIADSGLTPQHIQPEWYYLFAYSILRAFPSKTGGVLALVARVTVLFTLKLVPRPAIFKKQNMWKCNFFLLVHVFLIQTWIGAKPVEFPFSGIGKIFTLVYFSCFFFILF